MRLDRAVMVKNGVKFVLMLLIHLPLLLAVRHIRLIIC